MILNNLPPKQDSNIKFLLHLAEPSANFGTKRVRTIAGSGSYRFNFHVPGHAIQIVGIELIGYVGTGANTTGRNIDLVSEYGTIGEIDAQHTETDTTTTYNLTATANTLQAISVMSVLSQVAPGDYGGVQVDHVALGGSIYYMGVRVRYI